MFALNKTKKSDLDVDTLMHDNNAQVNAEGKRSLVTQRRQLKKADHQFPNEVNHEDKTPAHNRYAWYQAIKSFRESYWDPKENLPERYGAMCHFSSFKAMQRDVLGDVPGLEDVVQQRGWGAKVGSQSAAAKTVRSKTQTTSFPLWLAFASGFLHTACVELYFDLFPSGTTPSALEHW